MSKLLLLAGLGAAVSLAAFQESSALAADSRKGNGGQAKILEIEGAAGEVASPSAPSYPQAQLGRGGRPPWISDIFQLRRMNFNGFRTSPNYLGDFPVEIESLETGDVYRLDPVRRIYRLPGGRNPSYEDLISPRSSTRCSTKDVDGCLRLATAAMRAARPAGEVLKYFKIGCPAPKPAEACVEVAQYLSGNQGTPTSRRAAKSYLVTTCQTGSMQACSIIAKTMIREGRYGAPLPHALEALENSIRNGDVLSYMSLIASLQVAPKPLPAKLAGRVFNTLTEACRGSLFSQCASVLRLLEKGKKTEKMNALLRELCDGPRTPQEKALHCAALADQLNAAGKANEAEHYWELACLNGPRYPEIAAACSSLLRKSSKSGAEHEALTARICKEAKFPDACVETAKQQNAAGKAAEAQQAAEEARAVCGENGAMAWTSTVCKDRQQAIPKYMARKDVLRLTPSPIQAAVGALRKAEALRDPTDATSPALARFQDLGWKLEEATRLRKMDDRTLPYVAATRLLMDVGCSSEEENRSDCTEFKKALNEVVNKYGDSLPTNNDFCEIAATQILRDKGVKPAWFARFALANLHDFRIQKLLFGKQSVDNKLHYKKINRVFAEMAELKKVGANFRVESRVFSREARKLAKRIYELDSQDHEAVMRVLTLMDIADEGTPDKAFSDGVWHGLYVYDMNDRPFVNFDPVLGLVAMGAGAVAIAGGEALYALYAAPALATEVGVPTVFAMRSGLKTVLTPRLICGTAGLASGSVYAGMPEGDWGKFASDDFFLGFLDVKKKARDPLESMKEFRAHVKAHAQDTTDFFLAACPKEMKADPGKIAAP